MNTENFAELAPKYWEKGYSVIPIQPNEKRPAKEIKGWQGYCDNLPKETTREIWCQKYANYGIGLLTGKELAKGSRIAAIDVDDDRYVKVTKAILGTCDCAKLGKKGATFFVRAGEHLKSTSLKDAEKNGIIDVLINSKLTVIPPTIHPETGDPYRWLENPLLDCSFDNLPVYDSYKSQLLKNVVASPHTLVLIQGDATHDAGVAFSAQLVSFGCEEEEIISIFRALLPENYDGNSFKELPGWIESAKAKGFDEQKKAKPTLDEFVARRIEEDLSPLIYVSGDDFLRYQNGYWEHYYEPDIDRLAKDYLLQIGGKIGQVMPLLKNIKGCLALNVERRNFGAYSHRICVNNGTIDVKTGQLLDWNEDHELRYKLDIDYDPEATCPVYEEQLQWTFNGDQQAIDLFNEYSGLTLIPEMNFQKALYLLGAGGSGKSTLLRVIESMHNRDAISVTPLDKIDNERYLTNLARKLVCISFDIQTQRKVFGEAFIRITGGDPVATRKLYDEVDGHVIPTVRFVGSMNPDMPDFIASPDALERRLIFLKCGAKVENPDPQRFEKIVSEKSGILTLWIGL